MESTGKVASAAIDGLKGQPFALALVLVNVIFLLGGLWFMHAVAERSAARDSLILQLAKDCKQ